MPFLLLADPLLAYPPPTPIYTVRPPPSPRVANRRCLVLDGGQCNSVRALRGIGGALRPPDAVVVPNNCTEPGPRPTERGGGEEEGRGGKGFGRGGGWCRGPLCDSEWEECGSGWHPAPMAEPLDPRASSALRVGRGRLP